MSYVVLARKYRPKTFAEMVGQEHVVQALGNALRTQRLHHAYLFTGTRGVGKTTVSRVLAKSLNCTGPDGQGGITDQPCGVCEACRDIDAGRFVDYTELDAASNRGVDEVQSLLEQAVYKPVQGRFKVFMIDEVHMLTNTAFNAMLKTLEEPPEYLKFVLATTDPQKVPVTVLSRCLQFNLRPMAPQTVQEHLQRVLSVEGVDSDVGALALLSRAARGSMRDALSLTDQAIAFGGGALREEAVRQMLGAVDRHHVWSLLDALAAADGGAVVALVDDVRAQGFSAAALLEDLLTVLQSVAVCQLVPSRAPLSPTDPEAGRVQQLATRLLPDETQLLYSLCLHGRAELGLAPDEYAAMTMVLLRLLVFRAPEGQKKNLTLTAETAPVPESSSRSSAATTPQPPAPVDQQQITGGREPAEKSHSPRGRAEPPSTGHDTVDLPVAAAPVAVERDPDPGRTAPVPVNAAAAMAAAEAIPEPASQSLADVWFEVVQDLVRAEAVSALVRELALQSCLLQRQNGVWQLGVPGASLLHEGSRDKLQAALIRHGHDVRLELQVVAAVDSPARRLAALAAERQQHAEQLLQSDPFVQAMLRDFGGKIVPGSVQAL